MFARNIATQPNVARVKIHRYETDNDDA